MGNGLDQFVNIPQTAYLKENAARLQPSGDAAKMETELSSLLTTLSQMARETRGITANILERVSPQLPDGECGQERFAISGYIGRAEEVRSTLVETILLLGTLSKLI